MQCPQCLEEKAQADNEYGVLPCLKCSDENKKIPKPSSDKSYDFASPITKEQRKTYGHEMIQPYINGVLSKEFIEVHGTDRLAGVTKKDIKNAKNVYSGFTRHHKIMAAGKHKLNRSPQIKDDNYKVKGV